MKKYLIFLLIISLSSCLIDVQPNPIFIIKGEPCRVTVKGLEMDKGTEELAIFDAWNDSVKIKTLGYDTTFHVQIHFDSTIVIDVSKKGITSKTHSRR